MSPLLTHSSNRAARPCHARRYGEHCALLHGEVCEYCQCQVLHPYDPEQQRRHRAECLSTHERDMEHSFRMAKSIDKACGICMEVVVEKVGPRLPSWDGVIGRKNGSGHGVGSTERDWTIHFESK